MRRSLRARAAGPSPTRWRRRAGPPLRARRPRHDDQCRSAAAGLHDDDSHGDDEEGKTWQQGGPGLVGPGHSQQCHCCSSEHHLGRAPAAPRRSGQRDRGDLHRQRCVGVGVAERAGQRPAAQCPWSDDDPRREAHDRHGGNHPGPSGREATQEVAAGQQRPARPPCRARLHLGGAPTAGSTRPVRSRGRHRRDRGRASRLVARSCRHARRWRAGWARGHHATGRRPLDERRREPWRAAARRPCRRGAGLRRRQIHAARRPFLAPRTAGDAARAPSPPPWSWLACSIRRPSASSPGSEPVGCGCTPVPDRRSRRAGHPQGRCGRCSCDVLLVDRDHRRRCGGRLLARRRTPHSAPGTASGRTVRRGPVDRLRTRDLCGRPERDAAAAVPIRLDERLARGGRWTVLRARDRAGSRRVGSMGGGGRPGGRLGLGLVISAIGAAGCRGCASPGRSSGRTSGSRVG